MIYYLFHGISANFKYLYPSPRGHGMWSTAGPGFSSQVQVDVQGGFSPSCCSTTPIHLVL